MELPLMLMVEEGVELFEIYFLELEEGLKLTVHCYKYQPMLSLSSLY